MDNKIYMFLISSQNPGVGRSSVRCPVENNQTKKGSGMVNRLISAMLENEERARTVLAAVAVLAGLLAIAVAVIARP